MRRGHHALILLTKPFVPVGGYYIIYVIANAARYYFKNIKQFPTAAEGFGNF